MPFVPYGHPAGREQTCVVQQHVYYADWTKEKYQAVFTVYIFLFIVLALWLGWHLVTWIRSTMPPEEEQ